MFDRKKMDKFLSDFVNLNKPFLINKFGTLLKPYSKFIYLSFVIIFLICSLSALAMIFSGSISIGIIYLFLIFSFYIILRMFCEYLVNTPSVVSTKKQELVENKTVHLIQKKKK